MAWVLLDDDFPTHPKTVAVGRSAVAAYVFGLCFCRKYFTGGFIPDHAIATISVTTREIERLTTIYPPAESPYWVRVRGGYQVHGYADIYNDAADKAKAATRKQQKREAGRAGGLSSAASRQAQRQAGCQAGAQAESKQSANHTASESEAHRDGMVLGVGVLEKEKNGVVPILDGKWHELVAAYPKHRISTGARAQHLFVQALIDDPDVTFARMLANLERHKLGAQWTQQGGRYIPKLDKWLADEWEQVHEPATASTGKTGAPPKGKYAGVEQ